MEHPLQQTKEFTVQRNLFTLSGGDFTVTDSNGNVLFKSSGKVISLHHRRLLREASGNPLLTLKKKICTMHKRWDVFNGDSFKSQNFVFSVKKSSVFQLKTALDVFMAGNKDEKLCDFHVNSSFFNRSCTVYQGGRAVAEMKRKCTVPDVLLGRTPYSVIVQPGVDHAFIAALIIILDNIHCF